MENKKQLIGCALGLGLLMIVCGILLTGILRILALAVLYFVEMEVVMTILYPKQSKLSKEERIKAEDQWYFDRQEYDKMYDMRRVGTVMHVVAVALMIIAVFRIVANPVWGLLCFGCTVASVVLCAVYPAYFSFIHSEKEKNRKHSFPIVNLTVPFICPLVGFIPYEYAVTIADWMRLAEIVLLMGAVMGIVLRLLVPEFRRNAGQWGMGLFIGCACLAGLVLPMNALLETEEPVVVSGVVMDYDSGGRHSSAKYEVQLEGGETVDIPVNRRSYDEGDEVELEYHIGGLGIEYYTYAD